MSKIGATRPSVLLIYPRFSVPGKKTLPVGLCYLAAYARARMRNLDLEIFDAQILNADWSRIRRKLLEKRWGMIGLSYWTLQAEDAFAISDLAKKLTGSFVVHGGVHATLCPEEAMPHADCVVLHEGEETFFELARTVLEGDGELRKVRGLMYKKKGRTIKTPARPFISDLDGLPFPAFDLLPLRLYDSPMHITGGRMLPLIGSRGCPYRCTFCASPLFWKRKLRARSAANVVAEIVENRRRHGIRQIHFYDDNLLINGGGDRSWMRELCRLLSGKGRRTNWCGISRAEHVVRHRSLLPLMKKAGCVGLEIGIESFDDRAARALAKGETADEMAKAVRMLRSAGLASMYNSMIFCPGETISSYHRKEIFLNSIEMKEFGWHNRLGMAATPLRKTVFERQAPDLGVTLCHRLDHHHHRRVNFIPFSLLEDIPAINAPEGLMARVAESLELVLTGMSLGSKEARAYLLTAAILLQYINGKDSLGQIIETMIAEYHLPKETTMQYCALAVAALARKNVIKSNRRTPKVRRQGFGL